MQEPCSCSHHRAGGMAFTAVVPVHGKGVGGGLKWGPCWPAALSLMQINLWFWEWLLAGKKGQNAMGIVVWKSVIKCVCTMCTLLSRTITSISASAWPQNRSVYCQQAAHCSAFALTRHPNDLVKRCNPAASGHKIHQCLKIVKLTLAWASTAFYIPGGFLYLFVAGREGKLYSSDCLLSVVCAAPCSTVSGICIWRGDQTLLCIDWEWINILQALWISIMQLLYSY